MGIFFLEVGVVLFFKRGNTSKPSLVTWAVIFFFFFSFCSFEIFYNKECFLFEDWGVGERAVGRNLAV